MRLFALIAAILAFAALMQFSYADQNPAPTSVGLINYSSLSVLSTWGSTVLPRRENRAGLIVQNGSYNTSVVIKLGSTPADITDGLVLAPGAIWQPSPPVVDALYGKSASGTVKLIMIELAK